MAVHMVQQESGLGDLQTAVQDLEKKDESVIQVIPTGNGWLVITKAPPKRKTVTRTRKPKTVTRTKK